MTTTDSHTTFFVRNRTTGDNSLSDRDVESESDIRSIYVDSYLAELRRKFPEANFSSDSERDESHQSGVNNFLIAQNVLEHMVDDSEFRMIFEDLFAAQIELNFALAESHRMAGRELLAHGVVVKPDGAFSVWSSVADADRVTKRREKTAVKRSRGNTICEIISWDKRTA